MADKNIKRIVETRADIVANMGSGKIAIEKNGNENFVYTTDGGTIKNVANTGETGMFERVIDTTLADAELLSGDSNGRIIPSTYAGITGLQASQVAYIPVGITLPSNNVESTLDYLLSDAFSVSLSVTPAAPEKGDTVTDVDCVMAVNNGATPNWITEYEGQGGTGVIGSETAFGYTGLSLAADKTFTLYAYDTILGETGVGSDSVNFSLYSYWGQSASDYTAIDETIIEAAASGGSTLETDAAGSKSKGIFSQAGGGNYIYYAYPAAWGVLSNVVVNGFASTWNYATVSVTNAEGNTENYYAYVSPYTIAGTVTLAFS